MKIAFIVARAIQINTSSSIRNRAIINGLVANGHEVEVISIAPSKDHNNYDENLSLENVDFKFLPNGNAAQLSSNFQKNTFLNYIRIFAYKVYNTFNIYDNTKQWIKYTKEVNLDNYDLIISSSDPKSSHLFVHKLLNENKDSKVKWIQIWGDPYVSDMTIKNKFLLSKIKREEQKLLHDANCVYYVSELTLEFQKSLYSQFKNKMFSIPIPYTKQILYPESQNINQLKIAYCGDYNSNIRNIKPLYNVCEKKGYSLEICGHSDLQLNSSNQIKINGRVGVKKVEEIEEKSNVLVHLSNLYGNQIPGKIYQYSATNKYILFILDGEKKEKEKIKQIFSKYNRYIFCDNNEKDILNTLENINNIEVINQPIKEFEAHYVAKILLSN
ncbi:hypothetical protein [Turicibacter bilis]|uniref:hypothetical protein n=1 Tax=Turicibacter bilis TaxID=2735723 RepID=UPI003F8AB3FD